MVAAQLTALMPGAGPPPTRIASVFINVDVYRTTTDRGLLRSDPCRAPPRRSARGHRPDGLDARPTHAVHLVHHVAHHAAVIGDDLDDVADGGTRPAAGEVDDAMFLGKAGDGGLRILHHMAKP